MNLKPIKEITLSIEDNKGIKEKDKRLLLYDLKIPFEDIEEIERKINKAIQNFEEGKQYKNNISNMFNHFKSMFYLIKSKIITIGENK